MKKNNTININYYGLLCVVLLFCIFIGKLIYVSYAKVVDGMNIKEFAASRNTAVETLQASRGEILSSNGEILAKDVNSYTVLAYLDSSRTVNPAYPAHVVDKEYTAEVLSQYINMSKEYILELLKYDEYYGSYQVELGPGGRNISEKKKQEIAALDLPGIDFIRSTKRYYPYGDFASYIIGYAKKYEDEKIVGELGVEAKFDSELTGVDGYLKYQQDAFGYQIADTPVIKKDAKSGQDIYLTIDSNIQMYLENALDTLKNYDMDWATVTVANAKTGAILGSASIPSFDPNILNIEMWEAPLSSFQYDPGSTMKIYTFMAAMEEGIYDGKETYPSGMYAVDGGVVYDWWNPGWGDITYDTALTYSSNTAAARLAIELGGEKLADYFRKFGFGSPTGIEMSNEYSGKLCPDYGFICSAPIYELDIANAGFGQGITTTPIQNIQALTMLANNGEMIKPYIIEKRVDSETNKVLYQAETTNLGKKVNKETVDHMLELLYETVNGEDDWVTGYAYKTKNVTLIGKTGTAEIYENDGYGHGVFNNTRSFAGIFPYEDPEYIIYFSARRIQAENGILGNAVKSIVESIVKYKNLEEIVAEEDSSKIIVVKNYINKSTETTKKELESLGLNVIVIGNGDRVIDQSLMKGSTIIKGNKIFIRTNSKEIVMPDMLGWTSSETRSYCTIVDLECNITGYGKVNAQSINAGDIILNGDTLDLSLIRIEENTIEESGEDGEETENEE